ncbi:unnamed protein product [Rotaria socialis]|uniref:Uncharacterized protein n=1 Tax=Rotaria socialis TaxID=392032 RepID=A0A821UC02_9BILA|nr:unnamed protein product [Rotaria socialis]
MEAKDFAFQECSKKEATFTAEKLAKFIDERFYDLNNLKKAEHKLIRSIESCRIDLRRFGYKYTENKARPYFLGHEREDVVQHREQFVTYLWNIKITFIQLQRDNNLSGLNQRVIQLFYYVTMKAPINPGKYLPNVEYLKIMLRSTTKDAGEDKEFKRASNKYPDLNNDSNITYEAQTASATMDIGGNNYFDNETILKQFERLFQLLYFKVAYKDHDFVCLVDNARTHTAAEYSVNDFAMKPGGRERSQSSNDYWSNVSSSNNISSNDILSNVNSSNNFWSNDFSSNVNSSNDVLSKILKIFLKLLLDLENNSEG